jgi:hypothetical protein
MMQMEVFSQFFIAYYDNNGAYVDDMREVAKRYTMSFSSFWFDLSTSLPWSYLDLYAYQVLLLLLLLLLLRLLLFPLRLQ